MKPKLRVLIVIVAVILSNLYANGQNKHSIKLFVNTTEINKNEVNKYCNFGQTDGSSNEDFTIIAKVGDSISWTGIAIPPSNGIVKIKKIKYEKGTRIFKKDSLKGSHKVTGKVKYNTQGKPDFKYKIQFTVLQNGKEKKYFIDPKIRVTK